MENTSNEERLFDLIYQDTMDIEEEASESNTVFSKDVGLLNQNSGAGYVARDTGVLEAWSANNLGFAFNPETDSLTVMATNIVLMTKKIVQVAEPGDYLTESKQNILFLAEEVKKNG